MEKDQVLSLFKRVLTHYGEKARGATKTEVGDALLGKELLDLDIGSIEKETEGALKELASGNSDYHFGEFVKVHEKLLTDAFKVYVSDLQGSREEFVKRLGSEPELRSFDRELMFAQRVQGDVAKRSSG
ncbi:MAG: hypothetical protein ABSB29_02570 [Nitrososphaerales archaeon]